MGILLKSAVMYFTLDSEANEDPPEFTLTCQSKGGPATEVEYCIALIVRGSKFA